MNNFKDKSIVIFDGVCNLCNSSVNFIIKHDKKKTFLFASLQSDAAKEILLQFPSKKITLNTIIFINKGKYYDKSTAVLLIFKQLDLFYNLIYGFIIVPKFLRDFVYNFIAKHRYKWFGKSNTCAIPTPELIDRFLQ
ncbi:thiol-disulfide oxidoreductase DCC family protein [Lutibacter sp. HS1-25]|uniref:thiol-disulfide oxidoreductase DCC family protein n=1 Tax=Lutibacter sp. HS1-25 TaxID=2485000 RepID=UPI001F0BD966|nr:thiol-disulfide oxidoreductase DCC family protein [Lutibacter sp. HS1-25]